MDAQIFPNSPTDWLLTKENVSRVMDIVANVIKVDKTYDIPYVAGYSLDGKTFYLDRDIGLMPYKGEMINVDKFLLVHEVVEKCILLWLYTLDVETQGKYMIAHQLAYAAECMAVKMEDIEVDVYDKFCMGVVKRVGNKRLVRVPGDLDLEPYKDEHDFETLQRMVQAAADVPVSS